MSVARVLIVVGVLLVPAGLAWPWLSRLGRFRLPGEITIGRGEFRFYVPITNLIGTGAVVSLILWLLNKVRREEITLVTPHAFNASHASCHRDRTRCARAHPA